VKKTDTDSSRSGARVPKQQRAWETQERILKAAVRVFSERSYEGASYRLIAEGAGVGQALVTYHFPSKEDLWVAALEWTLGKFQNRLRPNLEALQGLDPATRVKLIFQDFTRFCAEHPELLGLLMDGNRRDGPDLTRVANDSLRPTFELLRELIEAAQRDGTMPAGDPGLIYYAMIAVSCMVFSLTREFEQLTGRDPREPDMVEAQAALLGRLFFPGLADADGAGGQ